jgi:hypothetical protein
VLVATMCSPTIGSPDQTYLRAQPRQAGSTSASDTTRFSRMRGRPDGDHRTYLGPRTKVRRHDDRWGARRADSGAAAQSFREVHPTARWRQEPCGSRSQASADVWAGHERNAWLGGHLFGFVIGSATKSNPSWSITSLTPGAESTSPNGRTDNSSWLTSDRPTSIGRGLRDSYHNAGRHRRRRRKDNCHSRIRQHGHQLLR